ncbi:hypothetical protein ACIQVT_01235 [Streptomyces sp. NPDC100445]|uniref:hypothetical protein n=1 Tax=Streptomyces sp. NPDC100445 TaxID=3366102 RepID=UPI003804450E
MAGRLHGHLLVHEPPQRTIDELFELAAENGDMMESRRPADRRPRNPQPYPRRHVLPPGHGVRYWFE